MKIASIVFTMSSVFILSGCAVDLTPSAAQLQVLGQNSNIVQRCTMLGRPLYAEASAWDLQPMQNAVTNLRNLVSQRYPSADSVIITGSGNDLNPWVNGVPSQCF